MPRLITVMETIYFPKTTAVIKIIFSLKGAAYHARLTDINDQLLGTDDPVAAYSLQLADYTKSLNRFYN